MKRIEHYKTEADLCLAFAAIATAAGWKVYNETAGWDQLLVNAAGEQIGVQAKLKPNLKVLYQATEWIRSGPDWRLVLVGHSDGAFLSIAHKLKLIEVSPRHGGRIGFPDLSSPMHLECRWATEKRCSVPKYLPDVPAGVPCPVQLTDWKIREIRLCQILRSCGVLTRADFKAAGIDHRRWVGKWLEYPHATGTWKVKAGARLPDEDHPEVSAQIRSEMESVPT